MSNLFEARLSRLMSRPPSIRAAAGVIVTATALFVVGGGILIRILDHSEYPNIWVGMWWALQTVTTVGYGDVTPKQPSGANSRTGGLTPASRSIWSVLESRQ